MQTDIIARRTDLKTGRWVEIVRDSVAENPLQDWDWAGHLTLIPRYSWAGTYEGKDDPRDSEFRKRLRAIRIFGGVVLPVYAYDHSGVTFSVNNSYPFNDPWDGGQVGYAYMTAKEIEAEYEGDKAQAREHLKTMVLCADAYSNGECYGYRTYGPDGNELNSCWGFWNTYGTWQEFIKSLADEVPDEFSELVRDCSCGDIDPLEEVPARYFVPGFAPKN